MATYRRTTLVVPSHTQTKATAKNTHPRVTNGPRGRRSDSQITGGCTARARAAFSTSNEANRYSVRSP